MTKATQEELETLEFILSENFGEDIRKESLQEMLDTYGEASLETLIKRFGPGTYGNHEAMDRTHLLAETFSSFVLASPAVVLNEKLYRLASIIEGFMCELYQELGRQDFETQDA